MKKAMVFVALLLGTAVFGAIVFGGAAWFARGSSSAGVSQPGAGPVAQPATVAAPSENDGEAQLSGADSLSDFRLADFEFTDHTGQAVDHRIFDGEVTALAFFFTSCPGPCPVMIANMIDVQSRTAGSGLRFAAISVDGSRDTPEVLAAYAQRVGIDIERWRLMTGEPELVSKLAFDSLSYEIRTQPDFLVDGPDGRPMANILHPTRVLLIGPDRRLIGTYRYSSRDEMDRLIADATAEG